VVATLASAPCLLRAHSSGARRRVHGGRCATSVKTCTMTVSYSPSDFNEVTVLLQWRGTIMPLVLLRPVIWMLVLTHVAALYVHLYRPDIEIPVLPPKALTVPNGLLTFFLVFYSGNCYSRYYDLYGKCMGMAGAVMCWMGLLKTSFPRESPERLWNMARHIIASVYVLYFTLGGDASAGGKLITEDEWAVLLEHNLVSGKEKAVLSQYRGFKPFLLQCWGLDAVAQQLASDGFKAPGAAAGPFQNQAFALRGQCSGIVNSLAQPVPFPYYHIVSLMLNVNLVMVGYALISFDTLLTVPVFLIICLVCLGLKETAVSLADPFGGDAVDFETDVFMASILANAKALITHYTDIKTQLPLPPGSSHKVLMNGDSRDVERLSA